MMSVGVLKESLASHFLLCCPTSASVVLVGCAVTVDCLVSCAAGHSPGREGRPGTHSLSPCHSWTEVSLVQRLMELMSHFTSKKVKICRIPCQISWHWIRSRRQDCRSGMSLRTYLWISSRLISSLDHQLTSTLQT